jgi:hypothetical protein
MENNIITLFKNAENINPIKLREIINDPVLREKLLNRSVDPVFLSAILDKNSKCDL